MKARHLTPMLASLDIDGAGAAGVGKWDCSKSWKLVVLAVLFTTIMIR